MAVVAARAPLRQALRRRAGRGLQSRVGLTSLTSAVPPTGTTSPPTTAPPPSRSPPGGRKISAVPPAGQRRLNHAVHMAAVTQVSHRASEGRAYYDRKVKEGKTTKEALRCLKGA